MKKLLLPIALLGILNAKAQTIDTNSFKPLSVVYLDTTLQVRWNDTTKACALSATLFNDNLKNKAVFQWSLIAYSGRILQGGIIECSGEDYANWDGNNLFPFTFVASKLGLEIK